MFGQKSCCQSESHYFSKWQRNALAKVGPSRDPMATPSNWLQYSLSNVKNDNIFVTFNSHEQLKKYLEYMNTKHPNIKFTFEHEHNNSFLFLDVEICCENNKLTTSVYRKPTFSEVFTNFKSFIHTVYKFGLVYILLQCCFNITSSYEKFHNEINWLKQF